VVGPAFVGNHGVPIWTAGIAIVRVAAQFLIKLSVLADLFAVQFHTEAGSSGDRDRPVFVLHQSTLNDIIGQMVVVGIGGVGEIGYDRPQMEHGCQLDTEFA